MRTLPNTIERGDIYLEELCFWQCYIRRDARAIRQHIVALTQRVAHIGMELVPARP
jgi:hypothetical protein